MATQTPESQSARPDRSRLMVFMFTDVADSTRLKQPGAIGAAEYAKLSRLHDQVVRDIVGSYAGAEVLKDVGDGFMAVFETASDAVKAGVRIQHRILSDPAFTPPSSGSGFRIRIGLNQGEVSVLDLDINGKPKLIGPAADLTARLQSLAIPGQVLMSAPVFHDACAYIGSAMPDLASDAPVRLQWMSHGSYRLKGIERSQQVYEVGIVGLSPRRAPRNSEKDRLRRGVMFAGVGVVVLAVLLTIALFAVAREQALRVQNEAIAGFHARTLSSLNPGEVGQKVLGSIRSQHAKVLEEDGTLTDDERERLANEFKGAISWISPADVAADTIGWAIIENAAKAAPENLKDQPLAEAAVLHGLSRVYSLLDRNDRAEPLCRRAHELRLRELGTKDPMTIESLVWLSTVLVNQGKLDEAEDLCRQALALSERHAGDRQVVLIDALNNWFACLGSRGKWAEARPFIERAIAINESIPPEAYKRKDEWDDHVRQWCDLMHNHGFCLQALNDLEGAEKSYRRAMDARLTKLNDGEQNLLGSFNVLGDLLKRQGRLEEADRYLSQALDLRRRFLGEEHVDTVYSMHNMAELRIEQERWADAEKLINDAQRIIDDRIARIEPRNDVRRQVICCTLRLHERWNAREPNDRHAVAVAEAKARLAALPTREDGRAQACR